MILYNENGSRMGAFFISIPLQFLLANHSLNKFGTALASFVISL